VDPLLGGSAAITVSPNRRFLLQHRDADPQRRYWAEKIGWKPREILYLTQIAGILAQWGLRISCAII
jgi:hypothetical protein